MTLPRKIRLAFIAGILVPGILLALRPQSQAQTATQRVNSGKEWPVVNGDWANTRYSTLDQINSRNIGQLRGAWVSARFMDGAMSRSTPVVVDGRMFVTAGTRIYALNAKTGQTLWTYRTDLGTPPAGLETTMGQAMVLASGHALPNSQGVGVGEGILFAGLTDGRVIALDQRSGKLVWSHQAGDDPPKRGQAVSTAPVYADGMVFIGMANGDFGLRGRIVALDAKSGNEIWHFFAVPGAGEIGHDTWPRNNDSWKQGGGGVWQAGALDHELGMVYFAPGNTVPQTGGDVREGNNLFTDSVVALDMKTGKLRWYYQVIHHDLWDADGAGPTPLILYDAQVRGRTRKALAAMRADGYLFLLDRETGKPLIPVEERPVPQNPLQKTAATQPFPVHADSILPSCSDWKDTIPPGFVLGCNFDPYYPDKPNVLAPSFGVRVSPMSYSSQTGYFYAQGSASLSGRRRFSDDPWFFTVAAAGGSLSFFRLPTRSFIAAIDGRTDKIVWKHEVPSGIGRSGALTTAGGLMFHGGEDGNFEAYDAKTGERLWQFQTGSPGTPASSYEVDGEQYIAMAAGPSVWAFKLGGEIQPVSSTRQIVQVSRAGGVPTDANRIETASLIRDMGINGGQRYATDEHAFNPIRARAQVGTRVTWANNGRMVHTVIAQDGSWTTGPLQPGQEESVVFTKPGVYRYVCKEHPWAIGELTIVEKGEQSRAAVENPSNSPDAEQPGRLDGFYSAAQAVRGKDLYLQKCSNCHMEDLSGGGRAPALAGDSFMMAWGRRTLSDLYSKIRTSMPQDAPASLSPADYLDITAFLLKSNGLPAGSRELTSSPEALNRPISK